MPKLSVIDTSKNNFSGVVPTGWGYAGLSFLVTKGFALPPSVFAKCMCGTCACTMCHVPVLRLLITCLLNSLLSVSLVWKYIEPQDRLQR